MPRVRIQCGPILIGSTRHYSIFKMKHLQRCWTTFLRAWIVCGKVAEKLSFFVLTNEGKLATMCVE